MSYNLLRREIREYVFDEGWPALRKIQEASIKQSINTDNNLILAAPTASGKTEAAFLPAINSIQNWSGLKIIYVSPLIALINDQFKRMTDLCKYLDVPVTSWHGEASQSEKNNLLNNPAGVLLITPESLEAMFSVRANKAAKLFEEVEWIIVDEIHSFLDNNRGLHLKSLLERVTMMTKVNPRFIGMSATLNREDYGACKEFFVNGKETNVLLDKSSNILSKTVSFHKENDSLQSDEAIREIFDYSQRESMLIFPNSRNQVENIAMKLTKLGKEENSYTRYFAHHSAISREMRTNVEDFAKNSRNALFSICCTSTLELGIDIGSVDSVVQYNAPYSVSSLSQRLGRSGRKERKSILHFIATNPWALLQGLAAIELYEERNIDRVTPIKKPYDVFAQQIISCVLEKSGMPIEDLYKINQNYKSWNLISNSETKDLIDYLIQQEYLEIVDDEVITGPQVEPLLFAGNFFAHFLTEESLSVYDGNKKIGEIPLSANLDINSNIALGASSWTIIDINYDSKSILVKKATSGEAPSFLSVGGNVTNELRRKMKLILYGDKSNYADNIQCELDNLASLYTNENGFIWAYNGDGIITFEGTKVNNTLQIALNMIGNGNFALNERESSIVGPEIKENLAILNEDFNVERLRAFLSSNMKITDTFLANLKYGDLLPNNLKVDYILNNILDIEGTKLFLSELFKEELEDELLEDELSSNDQQS